MNYWIIKSEPEKYAYSQLEKDGQTFWDGVRNYQARNNLREMEKGDICCYYHSNEGKEIVGLAKVTKTAYQDPTTDDTNWVAVDIEPYKKLNKTVTLALMKTKPELANIALIRNGRLSVMKITKQEYDFIINLAK